MRADDLVARCFAGVVALIGYVTAAVVVLLSVFGLCGIVVLALHYTVGVQLPNPLEWLPPQWQQTIPPR